MPSLHSVIVGVDPGKHSGVVLVRVWRLDDNPTPLNAEVHTSKKVQGFALEKRTQTVYTGLGAFVDGVQKTLDEAFALDQDPVTGKKVPVFCVCEKFVITANSAKTGGDIALQVIGALRAVKHIHYPRLFLDVSQKSETKSAVTNPDITELGLKRRGDGLPDHAHDAARHVVKLVMRFREMGTVRVMRSCNQEV